MRRTYDFLPEIAPVTYGEIGFSWTATPPDLFSRVVLPDPVTVDAGHYLRAFYELQVYHWPWGSEIIPDPFFPPLGVSGLSSIQAFAGTCTSSVATTGAGNGNPLVEGIDTVTVIKSFLSDNVEPLREAGTYHDPTEGGSQAILSDITKSTYVTDSFYFTLNSVWTPGEFTGTWAQSGITGADAPTGSQLFFGYVFDPPYPVITAGDQVSLTWLFSWGRGFLDSV
jgi:hypothetical protein